ncbi:hypothetical protein AMTR_s00051p00194000 [Amborella trichopoda]|uniref:Uncharacterized protein n=1 Tax=Amborella trichopoda TaxID=13333 RepID=U5D367_AMBTC|nr:hypothetical protein AMTR_s00051p00194000 [Amborella trichopoda]
MNKQRKNLFDDKGTLLLPNYDVDEIEVAIANFLHIQPFMEPVAKKRRQRRSRLNVVNKGLPSKGWNPIAISFPSSPLMSEVRKDFFSVERETRV